MSISETNEAKTTKLYKPKELALFLSKKTGLQVTANRVNRLLEECGYQYKNYNKDWSLTQYAIRLNLGEYNITGSSYCSIVWKISALTPDIVIDDENCRIKARGGNVKLKEVKKTFTSAELLNYIKVTYGEKYEHLTEEDVNHALVSRGLLKTSTYDNSKNWLNLTDLAKDSFIGEEYWDIDNECYNTKWILAVHLFVIFFYDYENNSKQNL